uniref:LPS-responsive vesicle trafficking, beach and anchor containing n=1 Tax=Scleropages formosus TaxID=113540 RepID=A0A8C9V1S1_SCLFO
MAFRDKSDGTGDGGTSVPMETGVGDAHAAVSLSPGVPIRGIKMKFAVLRGLVEAGEVPDKDLVETVFSLLVGGQFDLEVNFIIQEAESVGCMVELLDQCEATCQVEMWSIFVAILKKSARNLQACTEVGLMELVLARIHEAHCTVADLLIDVLAVLARYSITVRQLKLLVSKLQGENGCWPPHAVKLLSVLKAAPHRVGPDAFFSFPGKSAAAIALPPIAKWPYHSGFTFHTWLRLDPVSSVSGEDKPYVYCFHTSKGLGYSAHFVGGCLIVTSLKSRGRGFQHCVKYDFRPQQWYMVTIVHVYNRWKNSEISCYVNGELASYGEITWLVSTSDTFDKCFLGSWETVDASRVFCGQMGAVYLFSEALSAAQILAVYHLGPGYKGTFRHRAECDLLFAEHHRTLLYDGKLSSCIAFTYNPRATDGQLCLESSPRDSPSVFVHSPHALMLQDVRDVSTHSVQSAIHSMGGVQVLFPLFAQLDYLQHSTDEVDTSVCHTLLSFLMELLRNSVSVQEQVLSCKAFLVIGYILEKSSKVHMTLSVLDIFLALARYLSSVPHGAPLLKQLCDYILFNPAIWVHAAAKVQTTLYTYLCTEFISTVTIYSAIRRVSTVLQVMHTLKYYYWVVNPQDRSGITPKGQGETDATHSSAVLSVYVFILNYLLTMHEDDNLMDVLQLLVALIAEHPSSMVPAFDQRNGIRIVYKLLASESEGIRVQAIKVLGYFLTSLAPKRKADVMVGHSLFSLLSERLLLQTGRFTMSTYNVLFEILTEQIHTQVVHRQHPEPDSSVKILNPQILKVIAVLLKNSPQSPSSMELRRIFLSDMIRLFNNSRENRRSVLQCSVWQEWMLSLCYMHPNTSEEHKITEMVFAVFRILLYHAIKYERGGWRVWVDTLSIAHSKVRHKENEANLLTEKLQQDLAEGGPDQTRTDISSHADTPVFSSGPQEVTALPCAAGPEGTQAVTVQVAVATVPRSEPFCVEGGPGPSGAAERSPTLTERSKRPAVDAGGGGFAESSAGTMALETGRDDAQAAVQGLDVLVDGSSEAVNPVASDVVLNGEPEVVPAQNTEEKAAAVDVCDEQASSERCGIPKGPSSRVSVSSEHLSDVNSQGRVSHDSLDSKANTAEKEGGDEMKDVISQKLAKEERRESGDTFDIQKSVVEKVEPGNSNGVCPSKEPAKVKEMKITRLDVSSVLSDTERLQPREQLSLVRADPALEASGQAVQGSSSGRAAIFHSSEFQWSHLHQRLLGDVLFSIETDVQMWRSHSNRTLMDFVSSSDNAVYVHNTVHLLSHMLDNVITACGGILPLLSAATSSSHELENMEPSQGLSPAAASSFLQRVMALADVLLLSNTLSFVEVEAEKNMGSGGILRQCLRLVCAVAVCSCLEQQRHSYNKCNTESASGHGALQSITGPSTLDPVDIFTSGVSLVREMDSLLQDVDIHRLRAAVFKDIENSKQAHHMALAVIYFISVLMVSKYRDILEPHRERELLQRSQSTESRGTTSNSQVASSSDSSQEELGPHHRQSLRRSDSGVASLGATSPSGPDATNEVLPALSSEVNQSQESFPSPAPSPLHSTKFTNVKEILRSLVSSPAEDILVDPRLLPPAFLGDAGDVVVEPAVQFRSFDRWASRLLPARSPITSVAVVMAASAPHCTNTEPVAGESRAALCAIYGIVHVQAQRSYHISEKLEQALEGAAALLRDIFVDFAPFLSRTLLGSHGQELLAEGTGLLCMKSSGSVVELVMLLCSQEWQCSIQKNAGVAFIDLVNEGRLLSRAMKEHLVRVANEAKFILSRQHNDDVHKHAEFESQCAQYAAERRGEEKLCDNLIRAARYRDHVMATQLIGKILHILTDKHGAWGSSALSRPRHFWRLDSWEDDLRRRRRFVRNPFGSSHPEATLKAARENGPEEDVLRGQRSIKKPSVGNATWESELLVDGDDEALSSLEDKDVESPAGAVILSTDAHLVAPAATLRGTLSISASELYFEVDEEDPAFRRTDPQVLAYTEGLHGKWLFTEIRAIFSRRYLLQNTALEIFLANRTAVMFNFADQTTVKKVVQRLPCVGVGTSYGLPQSRRVSLARPKQLFKESNMTERWQRRDISNFEYLMFLNTISGRTYCDLSQYPVFPWVISNYESEELDLTSPSNFRDLSKPVGVLNPRRAAYFSERYDSWEDKEVPKFHYGTHYSTSGFTQMWLLRVEPFATFFLNFQGGKFDHADRTFSSMSRAWRNCQEDTCDVKELIPEFYYLPEMFVNSNDFNLGVMDDGTVVSDVELPPWASTPEEFVRISRMALESEIVSSQLHLWIDLIFGYRQQGPEAVKALNVFYYLTYEGAVDLGSIGDPKLREAVEAQIRSFGQTPCQLLQDPHPARSPATQRTPLEFLEHPQQDVLMVLKFPSNSPVVHVAASTQPGPSGAAVITVTASRLFAVNKWHGLAVHQGSSVPEQQYQLPVEMDPLIASHTGTPRRQITDLLDQSVQMHTQCFVVTADHRFLLACGFWDDSFRVYAVDSGKLTQVVFGHRDVVTCLARSESYAGGHCYVLSGSRDATLLLWYWNGRNCSIGEEFVTPRAVMTGHDREVTCASVCAELGLVVSGCEEGPFLIHSMTGELLRALEGPAGCLRPRLVQTSSEGHCVVHYDGGHFCTFDINGKLLAHGTMEESIRTMLLSRDGQHLVSGGDRGVLTVWRTHDLKQLFAYPGCDAGIRSMALSHDQRCVIAGMASGSIVLFYNDFSRWRYDHQFKYCS